MDKKSKQINVETIVSESKSITSMLNEIMHDETKVEVGNMTAHVMMTLIAMYEESEAFRTVKERLTEEELAEFMSSLSATLCVSSYLCRFKSPNDPELMAFKKRHGIGPKNEA